MSGLAPTYTAAAESRDASPAHFADGLVTVSARNLPISEIIASIAAQAGLRLVEHVQLEHRITISIVRQPLPDVLAEILEDQSYTLYQASPRADGSADSIPGILWIFSEGASMAPAATVFFEAVLYQGTYAEKKEAIRELRRLGSPAAVQALSLALSDDDRRVRDAALGALSRVGSDEALAAIASTAMDSDPRARGEAAAALGAGDNESSARYLALALDDPDPRVRMAVVESLADVPFGAVPSNQSVATLSRALHDKDPAVRMAAVAAMEEIGGDVAQRTLLQMQTDDRTEVPEAIRESPHFNKQ